ncbi:NADH-quinone oxidoreductase subunit NuoE [Streptomyces sp. NPDC020731]|uniref:NADH-quinone oxidoreductase subunit NuoE n=1 Tax=Streptomyces sp. NPDC020731 TaxID=3365085 RepID=UPI0037B2E3B4
MTTSSSERSERGVSLGMPELPAPAYPDDVRARLETDAREVIARYPDSRSALLPLLHLVQSEEGHVTRTGMRFCADVLGLTTAEVTAVATFYTMYRRRPSGDYQVGVCTNTLCAVMGGDAIFEELQEHLGVGNGGTTDDGKVTLEHIECNAACDFAPVVMVNWEFFDNQTPESAKRMVDDLRAGRPVAPTRGAPLCTFKETARILAGFPDAREGAVEATGSAGPASLIGLKLAKGEATPARVVHPRGETPRDTPPHDPSPTEHLSSHDAPQDTSASDPAHPSPTTTRDGETSPRPSNPSGPVAEEGE